MGQPVMQWQILAKQPDKLANFYTKLFDWDIDTNNALNYRMVDTGSERGINGGIWPAPPQGPSMVSLYIEVDDVAIEIEGVHRTAPAECHQTYGSGKAQGQRPAVPSARMPNADQHKPPSRDKVRPIILVTGTPLRGWPGRDQA